MASDNFWGSFRRWRRTRPFWGGLLLLLSGIELFYTANMALGALEVHIGPQGFLSYLIPVILVVVGILCWYTPAQRVFYAIVGLLTALYSFIGLNLGGFFIGMLLGIVGGALALAWGPPRGRPVVPPAGAESETPAPSYSDDPVTEHIQIAGHDDRPHEHPGAYPDADPHEPRIVPGFGEESEGPTRRLHNPRTLGIIIVALGLTASFLIAGSKLPASAAECPEGLPSRSVAASPSSASPASSSSSSSSASGAANAASSKAAASKSEPAGPAGSTSSAAGSSSAAASSSATSPAARTGPVAEGLGDVLDGVGHLLGIGDSASSSPSTSPAPSKPSTSKPSTSESSTATAPATTPAADPSSPASETTAGPSPTHSTEPATTKPAPSASTDDDEIPCLGARVFGKTANADDVPVVADKPGVMEVGTLTLYNSTYDGVVDLRTGSGSMEALKFSMDRAVNKPFTLTVDRTVFKTPELTAKGAVRFYTPRMEGKLFGLIPVVFTPAQPPPLTLPVLWFTDVTIQLAFIRCDTLAGNPLSITQGS